MCSKKIFLPNETENQKETEPRKPNEGNRTKTKPEEIRTKKTNSYAADDDDDPNGVRQICPRSLFPLGVSI